MALVTYRAFIVTPGEEVVTSLYRPVPWEDPELEARCLVLRRAWMALWHNARAQGRPHVNEDPQDLFDHPPPDAACKCGIYTTIDPATAVEWAKQIAKPKASKDVLLARMAVWGRTMVYERGYRTSHAEITGIVLPPKPEDLDDSDLLELANWHEDDSMLESVARVAPYYDVPVLGYEEAVEEHEQAQEGGDERNG